MSIVESLRQAIMRDGRSLNIIEIETGVSRGLLSRFLRGERTMTIVTADKLFKGLGVSVKISKPKN